jgi:hypothetical protein
VQNEILLQYVDDRDHAQTGDERKAVWRTYAIAVLEELNRRAIGENRFRWRTAEGDDRLPKPFLHNWNRIPDDFLEELYRTLERARV